MLANSQAVQSYGIEKDFSGYGKTNASLLRRRFSGAGNLGSLRIAMHCGAASDWEMFNVCSPLPEEFHLEHRVTGGGHPPPVPTERGVRISPDVPSTELFGRPTTTT